MKKLTEIVAKHYGVYYKILFTDNKKRKFALPRQVVMYIARKKSPLSLSEIGDFFNRRHCTVVHACKVVEDLMIIYPAFKAEVDSFAEQFEYEGAEIESKNKLCKPVKFKL